VEAENVEVLSGDRVTCEFDLSGVTTGEWDVVVTDPEHGTDTLAGGFQVSDLRTWFLAEGSTAVTGDSSFETWVLLENPCGNEACVEITYLTPQGEVDGPGLILPPCSRCTVDVSQTVGNAWSVSTKVESDMPVVVERAMYFDNADGSRRSAHGSIGVPYSSRKWFLAEGSTGTNKGDSFETWVLVANPGTTRATVAVTYLIPTGQVSGPAFELEPGTRRTVNVADTLPGEWSVSATVQSDAPVVAERAVYWNTVDVYRQAAHGSVGVIAPSREWLLAEGSTGASENGCFETWILLSNPGDYTATVSAYYQTPQGEVKGPVFEMDRKSRFSLKVSDTVPDTYSVATSIVSDHPVIAERAVYWNTVDVHRQAAHGSVGVTAPSREWLLAEGSTGASENGCFETWILVQNPGSDKAVVNVEYMAGNSAVKGPTVVVEPGTRITFFVADTVPDTYSVSTMVTADKPVVAERALYWNQAGTPRAAAHQSIGFAPHGIGTECE
jgi:hypothetical protein